MQCIKRSGFLFKFLNWILSIALFFSTHWFIQNWNFTSQLKLEKIFLLAALSKIFNGWKQMNIDWYIFITWCLKFAIFLDRPLYFADSASLLCWYWQWGSQFCSIQASGEYASSFVRTYSFGLKEINIGQNCLCEKALHSLAQNNSIRLFRTGLDIQGTFAFALCWHDQKFWRLNIKNLFFSSVYKFIFNYLFKHLILKY